MSYALFINRNDIIKVSRYLIEDNSLEMLEVRDSNNVDIDIFVSKFR